MKIAAAALVALALAGCASPRTDWAGISKGVGQVTK
jgi:outer membrane murein-binding lipoprotein Lpp